MDAELHIVHKAEDGSIAVVAVLYKDGDADPLLAKVNIYCSLFTALGQITDYSNYL